MYENIVVGFDNSEYSKAAVIEASNWAKRSGGKFSLAHAVYFNEEEFGVAPEQVDERFRLRQECLPADKRYGSLQIRHRRRRPDRLG